MAPGQTREEYARKGDMHEEIHELRSMVSQLFDVEAQQRKRLIDFLDGVENCDSENEGWIHNALTVTNELPISASS